MADNDIYNNKKKYERFIQNLPLLTSLPDTRKRKYVVAYPGNLKYFEQLHKLFERKDQSYVQRLRSLRNLLIMTHHVKKDLVECTREDIEDVLIYAHTVNKSPRSKESFIRDIKYFWKNLFPEKDEQGRADETLTPYVVRHLSPKIDKSKQKLRNDRLTWEELERILNFFGNDPRMQFYIALAIESLGRPQEICYTKVRDIEWGDSYAKIWVSEHGKEGVKYLKCIDSYPYLLKWMAVHPHKDKVSSYLFIVNNKNDRQLNPFAINKRLRIACEKLSIAKHITAYSLKRNGVTFARMRGDSDMEIQHTAGWTSTKQLKAYDLSGADDSFKQALIKRGIVQDDKNNGEGIQKKICICGMQVGFAEKFCPQCKRLLNGLDIHEEFKRSEKMNQRNELILGFIDLLMKDPIVKERLNSVAQTVEASEILRDIVNSQ